MYLWKYWRESRILFLGSLLAVAVLTIAILRAHNFTLAVSTSPSDPRPELEKLSDVWPVFLYLQVLPLSFVAWIFGSFGVGTNIGEKSGLFLFTRPRSRGYFIWSDWSFGLLLVFVITLCLNLCLWLQMSRVLAGMGYNYHGSIFFRNGIVPLPAFLAITCGAAFLLAALIFSLTYFSTILVRTARGVFVSAGVLLAYVFLRMFIHYHWPSVELPSLLLPEFAYSGANTISGLADHLGIAMVARTAILLLFPLGAQFLIERTDM